MSKAQWTRQERIEDEAKWSCAVTHLKPWRSQEELSHCSEQDIKPGEGFEQSTVMI
jgi:hypothetical protein